MAKLQLESNPIINNTSYKYSITDYAAKLSGARVFGLKFREKLFILLFAILFNELGK